MNSYYFKTAYGQKISKEDLVKHIKNFIAYKKNFNYKILVGTDSENQRGGVEFLTAIVIHRIGNGAIYFWKRFFVKKNLDLYSRLWQEAIFSLEISKMLIKDLLGNNLYLDFEVHLDLSNNGKSQSVVKELINLIKTHGFDVKIKPYSYAASKIADHLL